MGNVKGYSIYHKRDAGDPSLHKGGPWFFQPRDFETNEVYSRGYRTYRAAAKAAVEDRNRVEFESASECS